MSYMKRRALRHRMMRMAVIKSQIKSVFASVCGCADDLMAAAGVIIVVFFLFPILMRIGGFLR